MPVNINASNSAGIQITADTSGVIQFQSNGANTVNISATGALVAAGDLTVSGTGTSTLSGNLTVSGTGNQSIAGTLQFNSGYGSVATAYGCRAWVNFNGTSTVAIRGSGNVTSITDNGTGDYTVNFTSAMPDGNYSATSLCERVSGTGNGNLMINFNTLAAVGSIRINCINPGIGLTDTAQAMIAVFR